jgi:hypothetical protein
MYSEGWAIALWEQDATLHVAWLASIEMIGSYDML